MAATYDDPGYRVVVTEIRSRLSERLGRPVNLGVTDKCLDADTFQYAIRFFEVENGKSKSFSTKMTPEGLTGAAASGKLNEYITFIVTSLYNELTPKENKQDAEVQS